LCAGAAKFQRGNLADPSKDSHPFCASNPSNLPAILLLGAVLYAGQKYQEVGAGFHGQRPKRIVLNRPANSIERKFRFEA
jgi:hypothetical protein